MNEPTQDELEAADSWERDDYVPGRPAMTAFRRAARLQQARWRERQGFPVGTQPIRPRHGVAFRPVGSRLPLEFAIDTGANFVTPQALEAARHRIAVTEPHQSIDHQRLWADLVWSSPLAVNLFGEVWADIAAADRVVRRWFPDAPGRVREVRFLHSPGRFDPAYLNSLRDFLAAFVLGLDDGSSGIVAVDVKFFERNKAEQPKPENMWRYGPVAEQSGVFADGAIDTLAGRTDLCVMWLEHLLLLSMLQHESASWTWGRYVVVHHPDNPDVADLLTRYRGYLTDDTTLLTDTLDDLLASGVLPTATSTAVSDRYL